ncbi:MAG: hypothetical protein ACPG5B_10495 [Chitinophagales bacterium]
MNMPDTMPPLFQVQAGLPPEKQSAKVVFEKYIQTRMGNAQANRLYANGDFYKIYLGSNQSLKKDSIVWKKVGTISQKGLDKIEAISKNSVVDYLSSGPHELVSMAVENVNWYFYFEHPKFVETQLRAWQWKWWQTPKFIGKTNHVLEHYLTYE